MYIIVTGKSLLDLVLKVNVKIRQGATVSGSIILYYGLYSQALQIESLTVNTLSIDKGKYKSLITELQDEFDRLEVDNAFFANFPHESIRVVARSSTKLVLNINRENCKDIKVLHYCLNIGELVSHTNIGD